MACESADVVAEFHEDGGFGVGVGDGLAVMVEGGVDDGLGRFGAAGEVVVESGQLADLPVLAEVAAEVAAWCGEGEAAVAREEVEEGFLFDGVDGGGAEGVVVEGVEGAVEVLADLAVAFLARVDAAVEVAELAADAVVVEGVPEDGFLEVGGHGQVLVNSLTTDYMDYTDYGVAARRVFTSANTVV